MIVSIRNLFWMQVTLTDMMPLLLLEAAAVVAAAAAVCLRGNTLVLSVCHQGIIFFLLSPEWPFFILDHGSII